MEIRRQTPGSTDTYSPTSAFNHHDTEEPVRPLGTLDRIALRPEQTAGAVVYRRPAQDSLRVDRCPRAASARSPYALGLAVACGSEFWADHVIGRTSRATVTGVRLTRGTMHFDPTRSLAVLGLAPTPAPRVAGRCGRLAPPDRADRRIGGRDRAPWS